MSANGTQLVATIDAVTGRATSFDEIERLHAEAERRFGAFVLDRVNPGARERDRHRLHLLPELLSDPAGRELLRFSLPVEVGGEGRDKFEWGVVRERLAYLARDTAFSVLFDIHVEVTELFLSSTTPAIAERYVPGLASGELTAVLAAFESADVFDWTTTARRTPRGWVLNGTKRLFAGAQFAHLIVVAARDADTSDILAFVVERGDPGVCLSGLETMGLRSLGFGQLMLSDVLVDETRQLWPADALSEFNTYARNGRLMSAAGLVGATEATFDHSVERLSNRYRGGRPVVDYPNVERSIGELKIAIEVAKAALYRALEATRRPRDAYFDPLATAAKHHASEAAMKVGQHVMQYHSGEAYMSVHPWEQYVRDMSSAFGGQGAQELLLMQLGQRVVVGSEQRRRQEEAVERQLSKLSDAWLATAAAAAGRVDGPLGEAVAAVLEAAGPQPEREAARTVVRRALAGNLDAAAPPRCAAFAAFAAALHEGVLDAVLAGALDPADEAAASLLEALRGVRLARRGDAGWTLAPGLRWLAAAGPRRRRLEHDVRLALALGAQLAGVRPAVAARGAAGALCDHFLDRLLGQLVGLEERLTAPGAGVLVTSAELAAELVRRLPRAVAVDLDDSDPGVRGAALAWLPGDRFAGVDGAPRLEAVAAALEPGGWVALVGERSEDPLGAAVLRLRSLLLSGAHASDRDLEALLAGRGFAGVRTLPGPAGTRRCFVVGRRVTAGLGA